MWQIVSLLKDPDLQAGFLTAPNEHYDGNGDRVYEEMNTGNWWVKTQELAGTPQVDDVLECHVLVLIVACRAQSLSRSSSTSMAHG